MSRTRLRPGDDSGAGALMVSQTEDIVPAGDILVPVVGAVIGEPCRGRTLTLVIVVDCCHCGGVHRHLSRQIRLSGLTRACPETGLPYAIVRMPRRRAVRRG